MASERPTAMAEPTGRRKNGGARARASGALAEFPARSIYRALLVRGLEPGEAANLTAYLAGPPSTNLHWTIPEVEALLRRRVELSRRPKGDADDRPAPEQLTWHSS